MSEGKHDRSMAPRQGTRASRAKERRDRNVKPPAFKFKPPGKPKKGEKVMKAQLAKEPPTSLVEHDSETSALVEPIKVLLPTVVDDPEYPLPPKDPWWTEERERAYQMVLSGLPQHQIAGELGRHRMTIARWVEEERFLDRLQGENESRFHSMRQRRTMQTVRITDKTFALAEKMIAEANANPKDMNSRLAARDWLSEFREQSRREDEIYGLDKQRVDVNVHGSVQHNHKGKVDLSFKEFLTGSLRRMGVDVDAEEIDSGRADDALVAITEKALNEGQFLDDLIESEKQEMLLNAQKEPGR